MGIKPREGGLEAQKKWENTLEAFKGEHTDSPDHAIIFGPHAHFSCVLFGVPVLWQKAGR